MSSSHQPGKEFRHTRLPSPRFIRLLQLAPSTDFRLPLEITLMEVSLDLGSSNQRYEALSYVWGAPAGTCSIKCHGKRLLVTPNCESALRHLRRPGAPRTLWVDAVCIDQGATRQGIAERNAQVPLMGEIYAKAEGTLCWLGEGIAFTDDVMRHLERIGRCPSVRGLRKLMSFEEKLQAKNLLDKETSCLDHIFCHPWHSRVWTVQEVAFATKCQMLCGSSAISWDDYAAAAIFLIYEQFIDTLDLQAAKSMVGIDMRNVLRSYLQDSPAAHRGSEQDESRRIVYLTSCLADVSQLLSTEPKDKIYGLYAIATKLGIGLPAVDYDASLVQVYTEAAIAMITWSASLKILADACSSTRDQTLPSWVPDRNDDGARLFMPSSNATRGSHIRNASLNSLSPVFGKLRVPGMIIGEVIQGGFSPMPFPVQGHNSSLAILPDAASYRYISDVSFLRFLVEQINFYRTLLYALSTNSRLHQDCDVTYIFHELATIGGEAIETDLWSTWMDLLKYPESRYDLSLGHLLAEDWRATDTKYPENWTSEIRHCVTIAAALLSNSIQYNNQPHPLRDALLDQFKDISSNLAEKAIICVKLDHVHFSSIGTTFHSVTSHDIVVLLEGAEWPMVLRPSGPEWVVIGPAFIIGVMGGELWSQNQDLRDFVLI